MNVENGSRVCDVTNIQKGLTISSILAILNLISKIG